jgi:hypothetical protein
LSTYRAFVIGLAELAVGVHEIDALCDGDALAQAAKLQDGPERLEVWCGSRKVGDIPTKPEISEGKRLQDSA